MRNNKIGFYLLVAVLFVAGSSLHGSDGEKEKSSGVKSPTSSIILKIMKQKSDKWVGVSEMPKKVKKKGSVARSKFREFLEKDKNQDGGESTLKKAQKKARYKKVFGADIEKTEDEETLSHLSGSDRSDSSGTISEWSEDFGAEADEEESDEEEESS